MPKKIYKQRFRQAWLEHPLFRKWLTVKESPDGLVPSCRLCHRVLDVKFHGLMKHNDCKKHQHKLNAITTQSESEMCLYRISSKLWNHFVRLDSDRARCKYCKRELSHENSTSELEEHLNSEHPNVKYSSSVQTFTDSDMLKTKNPVLSGRQHLARDKRKFKIIVSPRSGPLLVPYENNETTDHEKTVFMAYEFSCGNFWRRFVRCAANILRLLQQAPGAGGSLRGEARPNSNNREFKIAVSPGSHIVPCEKKETADRKVEEVIVDDSDTSIPEDVTYLEDPFPESDHENKFDSSEISHERKFVPNKKAKVPKKIKPIGAPVDKDNTIEHFGRYVMSLLYNMPVELANQIQLDTVSMMLSAKNKYEMGKNVTSTAAVDASTMDMNVTATEDTGS